MADASHSMQNMGQQFGIKPSEQEIFNRFVSKMTNMMRQEARWEKLKEPMIDLYLKHYTTKEIENMIAFYKSDSGQSMLKKMPEITKESIAISQQLFSDIGPQMRTLQQELQEELRAARSKSDE